MVAYRLSQPFAVPMRPVALNRFQGIDRRFVVGLAVSCILCGLSRIPACLPRWPSPPGRRLFFDRRVLSTMPVTVILILPHLLWRRHAEVAVELGVGVARYSNATAMPFGSVLQRAVICLGPTSARRGAGWIARCSVCAGRPLGLG
jgi:hypothetical protein